jgi:hypothetical protein
LIQVCRAKISSKKSFNQLHQTKPSDMGTSASSFT